MSDHWFIHLPLSFPVPQSHCRSSTEIRQHISPPPCEIHISPWLLCSLIFFTDQHVSSERNTRSSRCCQDVSPTWFLKSFPHTAGPNILPVINFYLSTDIFPSSFKHAIVRPLVKWSTFDMFDSTSRSIFRLLLFWGVPVILSTRLYIPTGAVSEQDPSQTLFLSSLLNQHLLR